MKPFQFKQFIVHQDKCAMKIGTDGVLLGAWTSLDLNPESILDIGTGTGVIALQLAQRSMAQTIDAVELDSDAYEQCVENFEASTWGDRLFCYHASFEEFYLEIDETYDLIVTNPPFYSEDVDSGNNSRNLARQNQSLPYEELVSGVVKLLTENGNFATIIPFKDEEDFIALAGAHSLFPSQICRVRGNPTATLKRSLLQFSRTETPPKIDELIIETDRHQYTSAYMELTKDFYLKM